MRDEREYPNDPTFHYELLLEISDGGKSVVAVDGDEGAKRAADLAWKLPETKLDVNATYAVRKMKRRALGLVKE